MTQAEAEQLRRAIWTRPNAAADAWRKGDTREAVRSFVDEFSFTTFGHFAGRELPTIADVGAPPPPREEAVSWLTAAAALPPVDAAAAKPESSEDGSARQRRLHAALEAELGAKQVLELRLWHGGLVYVPRELGPYVYSTVGDNRPRRDLSPEAEKGKLSWLAAEVFSQLRRAHEPMTVEALRQGIGQRASTLAVERALGELAGRMRVLRMGSRGGEALWQATVDALGDEFIHLRIGLVDAASALMSQWIYTMALDTEEAMAEFFQPLLTRSQIHAALQGIQASQPFKIASLEGRQAFTRLALSAPSDMAQ